MADECRRGTRVARVALWAACAAIGIGCGGQPPSADAGKADSGGADAGRFADAGHDAGGPADAGATTDAGPPVEVLTVCPSAGELAFPINGVVRVHASAPIDAGSVGFASLVVYDGTVPVQGTVTVDGQDLYFRPPAVLTADAGFTAVLSRYVVDVDGQPLTSSVESWSFSTGPSPAWDGGFRFTEPVLVDTSAPAFALALGADDAYALVTDSFSARLVGIPLDGGVPAPPVVLWTAPPFDAAFGPSLAAGNGYVHAAWYGLGANNGGSVLYYSREDLALSGPPDTVVPSAPQDGYEDLSPVVAADQASHVAYTWYRMPTDFSTLDAGVSLETSVDQGTSFASLVYLGSQTTACAVGYVDDWLVFLWAGSSVYVASSPDGVSYSSPVMTCGVFGPAGNVPIDDHRGHALWLCSADLGSGTPWELVRYTPSTNSIDAPIQVVPQQSTESVAQMASSPTGRLALVNGVLNPPSSGPVYACTLQVSDDDGASFTPPQPLSFEGNQALEPIPVALSSGDVFLLWSQPDPQNPDELPLDMTRAIPKRPCE